MSNDKKPPNKYIPPHLDLNNIPPARQAAQEELLMAFGISPVKEPSPSPTQSEDAKEVSTEVAKEVPTEVIEDIDTADDIGIPEAEEIAEVEGDENSKAILTETKKGAKSTPKSAPKKNNSKKVRGGLDEADLITKGINPSTIDRVIEDAINAGGFTPTDDIELDEGERVREKELAEERKAAGEQAYTEEQTDTGDLTIDKSTNSVYFDESDVDFDEEDVSGKNKKGSKRKPRKGNKAYLPNNTDNPLYKPASPNFTNPETPANPTSDPSQKDSSKHDSPPVVPSGDTPEGKSGVSAKIDNNPTPVVHIPTPTKSEELPQYNSVPKTEPVQKGFEDNKTPYEKIENSGTVPPQPILPENNGVKTSSIEPPQNNVTPSSDVAPKNEVAQREVSNDGGVVENQSKSSYTPSYQTSYSENNGYKEPSGESTSPEYKPSYLSGTKQPDNPSPPRVETPAYTGTKEPLKEGKNTTEVVRNENVDSGTTLSRPTDYVGVPPVVNGGNNPPPTNSPFIYDFKSELEKYVQGDTPVKVFETGTHITVQCDNFTTSIPKAEGIKPMPVGAEATSLAFNKLVGTLYDAQPEKPAVYDTPDVFTTEAIRTPPPEDKVAPKKSFWDIDTLNKNIQETYGNTAILSPTNNPNTYTIYGGTEHEANITLHPVSHRVVDVIYKSDNPSKATKDNIEAIKSTTKSYAELCRSTESAYERLESRKASLGQQAYSSGSAKKSLPQSIPGVTNKPIGNATQLSIITPAFYAASNFGSIATPYATAPINMYKTYMTNGAVATRLRTMYTMHLPESILSTHNLPLTQAGQNLMIDILRGQNALASLADEDIILSGQLGNTPNVQIHGTTGTNINDTTSRAVKNIDEANNIIPNRIYSGINSGYNLTPYHPGPNFKPLLNTTRGLALMAAIQLRQKAMQNPVGEGAQQVATYTILPFQMLYKSKPEKALAEGLKYLPSYNNAVSRYVKELRAIGIRSVDNPSLFQVSTLRNQLNRNARALGFEPSRLNQVKIASELKIRLDWLKNPSSIPAGKSVELIEKEINTLKALASANSLHLSKGNMTSYYVEFFRENGLNIPDTITNLTNRTQFAMLRNIVEREIGAKYGIDDITHLSVVRLEGLMKKHNFTAKELNILNLFAKPEMSRFSRIMQKADRRAMYFMLFLQRAMGQNETVTGAVKAYRWVRSVRMIIHYTRRINSIAQRMLSRLAHKRGWDKLIARNRSLSKFGRGVKKVPKKAVKGIGKGIKKGGKFASKHLAKTAVGRGAKQIVGKIARSTIGRATRSSIKFISRAASRITAKATQLAAQKLAVEASISQALGGAFGIGASGATTVGGALAVEGGALAVEGAGATVVEGAGVATVGGGAAATEATPVGWFITLVVVIVVVVLLIVLGLYLGLGPGIIQAFDNDREDKTFTETVNGLAELDSLFIQGMKDVRINHLSDEGDSGNIYTLPITEDEAERFDITGYYDPEKGENVTLKEWGWGQDAKDNSSIPSNNAKSTIVPSFKNTLYEAHNRGAVFSFTDSPQIIYYMHADDSAFGFDVVENTDVKNISYKSNAKEIISAVSVITKDEYSSAVGYTDSSMSKDMSHLFKGYTYKGVRLGNDASNLFIVEDSVSKVSLWSATHGYQTTASETYACNGCKDFSYECNSQEWKDLNNNSDFKFNKSTLTTLSGNKKALPYNKLGCYQHATLNTVSEKSNKEYYCGGYHKTSTGKYIKCEQANSNYSAVGHLYKDIYGTEILTGHKENVCKHYDLVPAGSKTVNESCYIQDKQYYTHKCPDFNVKGCSNVIDVSNIFGTTAYLITQSDFGIGGYFDRPSCASYTNQFTVTHGSSKTVYRLVYCTGHHNCNTNTIEKGSEPLKKTISQSFYIYYGNNTNDKATFIIDGKTATEPTFELTINDYCTHYKSSTRSVTYSLAKKVCKGHCDGHTKENNDHPCVYCIGHKDKLVSAYIISETNPETVPSKLYGNEYGHWDCLPFNTIYSADTCSGPISLARRGYVDDTNIISGISDKRDANWFLNVLNYKEWYADEFAVKNFKGAEAQRKRLSIRSSDAIRQDVHANLQGSWSDTYNSTIFSDVKKDVNGIWYGEYFGYCSPSLDTEWSYIESQIISKDATEQQLAFIGWAVSSCGEVPYYPEGTIKQKKKTSYEITNTNPETFNYKTDVIEKVNANGFGNVTSPDSAGRILYGVNESKWLNWCYASALSSDIIELPVGRLYLSENCYYGFSVEPNASSVQVNKLSLNANYNFTPTGCSNLPENAKLFRFDTFEKFKNGIQTGDIMVLKKKCPLCCKMFTQGSGATKCDKCDIALTQDFAIYIGWGDYAKSACENVHCDDYGNKFSYRYKCPTCEEPLASSSKPKGDDIFVIEMSSDACEENVVIKRYNERAFDISDNGLRNEFVVYRFLN